MRIKVLGCSVCKTPYDYSGIEYDSSKTYAQIPLCKKDEQHINGYDDVLIEIDFKKDVVVCPECKGKKE